MPRVRIFAYTPGSERPVSHAPAAVRMLLAFSLVIQVVWHGMQPAPVALAEALPEPPSRSFLDLAALGDRAGLARALMLWLQAFDNQPGISIPFRHLDYNRVAAWLGAILTLDPRSHYPLLTAARVYGDVADPGRQRRMIAFVRMEFLKDPDNRWPWMAHVIFIAKHRLHDLDLALSLARELRTRVDPDKVPAWARELELFVMEDQGDKEGARILLGGLIHSGVIKDPHEIRFLMQRLGQGAGG